MTSVYTTPVRRPAYLEPTDDVREVVNYSSMYDETTYIEEVAFVRYNEIVINGRSYYVWSGEEEDDDPIRGAMQPTTPDVTTTRFDGNSEQCCAISLEPFQKGDEIMTVNACGHSFARAQLEAWMRGQGTDACCPLCRAAIY